jgi:hypothetical protein
MVLPSYNNGFFQIGDWHDTLLIRDNKSPITVRTQTDYFPGKAVVHCHLLQHEDADMMAWIDIVDPTPDDSSDNKVDTSQFNPAQCVDTFITAGACQTCTGMDRKLLFGDLPCCYGANAKY